MKYMGGRRQYLTGTVAGVLSLLFVGVAAVPAHAETARERQWHLDAMQAEEMWEVSKGEGITVAVIDTGVDVSFPDLQGQVLKGKDFTDLPGGAHEDYQGHGTTMALLISGAGKGGPDRGSYGLAPESKILPLRINTGGTELADNAAEAHKEFAQTVAPAIRFAANSQAKIINISQASRAQSPKIADAIKYALSKGKLIFAGVGNSGEKANPVLYPAAFPGVIGVAAVDKAGTVTPESESGAQVDLSAPGKKMFHACESESGYCLSHGTSDATALASASAALLWAEHPDWTANQVTRVLVETAGGPSNGEERTDSIGYGIVRPRIALLEGPVDPGNPNTNPLPGPYFEGNAAPSTKPSANSGDGDDQANEDQVAAPSADSTDSGLSTGAWIAYGLLAAVVIAGAVATPIALARRKRSRPAPQASPYAGPPMPTAPPGSSWPDQPHQHQNSTGDYGRN